MREWPSSRIASITAERAIGSAYEREARKAGLHTRAVEPDGVLAVAKEPDERDLGVAPGLARGVADVAPLQLVDLDLRYVGQEHTLTVPVSYRGGAIVERAEEIRTLFDAAYGRLFGQALGLELELVTVRATARIELPELRHVAMAAPRASGRAEAVDAYSFILGRPADFAVIERATAK